MKLVNFHYRQDAQLIAVVLLIFLAISLRMVGVGYGLPNLFVQDEYHEVMRALELANGQFNMDRTGKGGLYFILFILYGLYYVASYLITGVSREEFAVQIVLDPTNFYLIGRYLSIFISAMTIYVSYIFSKKYVSKDFAYIPVAVIAISILDVELSREIRVDVLLSFLSILSMYFISEIHDSPTPRNFVKCGVIIGLATTTKITGVLLFAPMLIAMIAIGGYSSSWRGGLSEYRNRFFYCVIAFCLVLSITNPGIWKSLPGYFQFAPRMLDTSSDSFSDNDVTRTEMMGHVEYYFDVLRQKFGDILVGMAIAGGIIGLLRRNFVISIIFVYTLVVFLVLAKTGSETMYYPRYLLPVVAPLALLVGFFIQSTVQSIGNNRARHATAMVIPIVILIFVTYQSLQVYRDSATLNHADTRELAAEWFERHVDRDSIVAIEGTKITAARNAVPLRESTSGIQRRITYFEVVEPRQARYLKYLTDAYDRQPEKPRFSLVLYDVYNIPPLDVLRSQNVRYIVLDPDRVKSHRRANEMGAFLLKSLGDSRNARLIFKIDANLAVRPGPSVYIYEIEQESASRSNKAPSSTLDEL